MSFTVDDLLIIQDKQQIDELMNPYLFFININKWLETPRDKKQKLFAKYIDFITIDKIDKEINITGGNFRESFLADMRTNHKEYGIPYNFNLFEDGHIRWHWHKEVQFSYCISDKIRFFIEGKEIVLEAGEGIFVNSNVLHKITPCSNNCMMFSIVFDKVLIGGTPKSVIERKYVEPLVQSNNLKFILLKNQIK